MRFRIVTAVAAVLGAALLAGCGERNMVVNVDVLSYLDPATTTLVFGPVPAVPGGFSTNEVAVVNNADVNLISRPNDLAKVQNVSLTLAAQVADSTGAGSDTLRLYLSDANTDPLTTPAVAVLPLTMTSGQTDSVHVDVAGDQRLSTLFDGQKMRVSITNSLRGPASGADLNGRLQLTTLRATVVMNRKGL